MKLCPNQIYHVYNRGNNKQPIFYEDKNYRHFLKKVKMYMSPYCDILAYSLMSNHFHFQIHANERTNILYRRSNRLPRMKTKPKIELTLFSWGLQQLLSSYTKSINKQFNRTGSLFQQNTRWRKTSSDSLLDDYSLWCFKYIHNNPRNAGLVKSLEEYEFGSYREFVGRSELPLCNIPLAKKLLFLNANEMFHVSDQEIPADVLARLFK